MQLQVVSVSFDGLVVVVHGAILIVGAGPTGLTAAMELSRLGQPVRIIDKRNAPATTSRAIGVQARTLELLDQRGLAQELVSLGNKVHFGSVYSEGKRVFHIDFSHVKSSFPYLLLVSQSETERLLKEKAQAQGVQVEWQTELIAFSEVSHDQSSEGVIAILKKADGTLEEVQCSWLIDAEGARSTVRRTLDLPFEGKTRREVYVLADGHVDGDLPDSDVHIFASPHGFLGLFPLGGKRFRLIASNPLSTPSPDASPPASEIQDIYNQRSHIPARFTDISWTSWFHINSRMVKHLKVGRLFLGGDSAHIHSPAGGQGMNTGIQDMINLCWKLALVNDNKAKANLIETYEEERIPVIRGVLSHTEHLTDMIASEDHIVRTLFNHLGPWIGSRDVVQEQATNHMAQVAINYRSSSLCDHSHFGSSVGAGDRLPDCVVECNRDGQWLPQKLYPMLDPCGFTLLISRTEPPEGNPDEELNATTQKFALQVSKFEVRPQPEAAERHHEVFGKAGGALLIRPDGYVAFSCSPQRAPQALSQFLHRWFVTVGA